ncbi:MAG: hypothetical protein V3W02_05790 [Gammaproteobacteria bacterium]
MSKDEYRIAEVDEIGADAATVGQFIERNWRRPVALSLPSFYEWQFRNNPSDAGRDRSLVIVDREDRLHGFMGITGRELRLAGQSLNAVELTTWVVEEQLRGVGLGKAIVRHIQETHEAIVGMGISDSALAVYIRYGLKHVRYLPRYVKIFNPDAIEPISELNDLGRMLIRLEAPVTRLKHRARAIGFGEAARYSEPLHANYNCLARDAAHLEWRYAQHPFYRYEAFEVGDGTYSAAVILRVDDNDALRIVHVVDILGDKSSIPAVISFVETFCRDHKVDMSDFYCSLDRIGHMFWHHGWLSTVNDFYVQVPNWFYPIEMRHPPTTSLILWAKKDMCSLIDLSRLYITKGDCDGDRPTMRYLKEKGIPT